MLKNHLLPLLAIVLALLPRTAHAAVDPELAVTRSAVLIPMGETVDQNLQLYPLRKGLGRVFTQPVKKNGALALRVHFQLEGTAPAEPTWGVQILDKQGKVVWAQWAGEVLGNDFWSDEIPGDAATVEVYSVEPENPVRLTIDRLAARQDVSVDLSIKGHNDLAPIGKQDPWMIAAGTSVARITFMGDNGRWYYCTGFLVTRDLLLTNQHCLATRTEAKSAFVEFDYDSKHAIPKSVGVRQLEAYSYSLDYSLVRLFKAVDRVPLTALDEAPRDGEKLAIVQHPGGEPKQASVIDCQIDGASVEGRHLPSEPAQLTDFGHSCDTKPGSSGSPVIDFDLKKVVGIHHLGFDGPKLFNRAVRMSLILADIRAQRPDLTLSAPAAPAP